MNRDQFVSLPAAIALGILYDCLDEATVQALGAKEAPKAPRSPKYDRQIYRSNGVQWASETSLDGLRFWRERAAQPPSNPKYAEANAKQVAELDRWIAWREWFPVQPWSGQRGEQNVVAAPPADKPRVRQRQQNGQRKAAPPPEDDSFDPNTF